MTFKRNVLLGVSGGVAAYKAIELVSRLKKAGANVRVILTAGAQEFVTPLTFRAITGERVYTSLFADDDPIPHINLPQWADIYVVAPATADVISRFAVGAGSDLLSASMLSAACPKLVVPAMNTRMFDNPATQANLNTLRSRGFMVMPTDSGVLACGEVGKGRFPEPAEIVPWITGLTDHTQDLAGQRVLVTAGASREALDPMRYFSNRSSGRMGLAIARAAATRGAEVTLVHAHMEEPPPYNVSAVSAIDAASMHAETTRLAPQMDIVVMAAAVADYTLPVVHEHKLKKGDDLSLTLLRTKDILAELGVAKPAGQTLVGFAAESENVVENGRGKLERKRCDFLAANNLAVAGLADTTVEWISPSGAETLEGDKLTVAHAMLDRVVAVRSANA